MLVCCVGGVVVIERCVEVSVGRPYWGRDSLNIWWVVGKWE